MEIPSNANGLFIPVIKFGLSKLVKWGNGYLVERRALMPLIGILLGNLDFVANDSRNSH